MLLRAGNAELTAAPQMTKNILKKRVTKEDKSQTKSENVIKGRKLKKKNVCAGKSIVPSVFMVFYVS